MFSKDMWGLYVLDVIAIHHIIRKSRVCLYCRHEPVDGLHVLDHREYATREHQNQSDDTENSDGVQSDKYVCAR